MAGFGRLFVWICFGVLAGFTARAQNSATVNPARVEKQVSAAPVKRSCMVDASTPSPAESAYNKRDYSTAEKMFREVLAKNPASDAVHEGLIRTLIAEDKVADAVKDADAWSAAEPTNSMAMIALGDVRLRQGNPLEAYTHYQEAAQADVCNARAYYGLARVDQLSGMHASGKRLIEQAYVLHPGDDEIDGAWIDTRAYKLRITKLTDYAEHSTEMTDRQRVDLKSYLAKESQRRDSDCRMSATSPRETKVSMVPLMNGPESFSAWGLEVKFNGRKRHLEIDTGANGITISRAAAAALGLAKEESGIQGGIGDEGGTKSYLIHVAAVRVGNIELSNCAVEVLEKWNSSSDGLIGGDVFNASMVTLDFPGRELRISPLPKRPGEPSEKADAKDDDKAEVPQDPYVAPEMEKWSHIYRTGHYLLMPGGLVETKRSGDTSAWRSAIFLMDTGSQLNLISPKAAAQVTKVYEDPDHGIYGISGKVDKVYEAGKFTLGFGGLRLDSPVMKSIDTTRISHSAGVEVAGIIGAEALKQLVMHIDYRDDLVWCEYKAKNW